MIRARERVWMMRMDGGGGFYGIKFHQREKERESSPQGSLPLGILKALPPPNPFSLSLKDLYSTEEPGRFQSLPGRQEDGLDQWSND